MFHNIVRFMVQHQFQVANPSATCRVTANSAATCRVTVLSHLQARNRHRIKIDDQTADGPQWKEERDAFLIFCCCCDSVTLRCFKSGPKATVTAAAHGGAIGAARFGAGRMR